MQPRSNCLLPEWAEYLALQSLDPDLCSVITLATDLPQVGNPIRNQLDGLMEISRSFAENRGQFICHDSPLKWASACRDTNEKRVIVTVPKSIFLGSGRRYNTIRHGYMNKNTSTQQRSIDPAN
jgi:hypothetical protein